MTFRVPRWVSWLLVIWAAIYTISVCPMAAFWIALAWLSFWTLILDFPPNPSPPLDVCAKLRYTLSMTNRRSRRARKDTTHGSDDRPGAEL